MLHFYLETWEITLQYLIENNTIITNELIIHFVGVTFLSGDMGDNSTILIENNTIKLMTYIL